MKATPNNRPPSPHGAGHKPNTGQVLPRQTPAALLWALGFGGSACAHLAGFAALMPFLSPKPIPQQPNPQSALTLEAHQIPRSTAQEQQATPDPSTQLPSQGDSLGSTALAQTTARISPPDLSRVAPAPTTGAQLSSLVAPGEVAAVKNPKPQSLSARPAVVENIAAQNPAPSVSRPQLPALTSVSAAEVSLSSASSLPVQALSRVVTPQQAVNTALPARDPKPQQAAETPPQPDQITAALAFQGSASTDLDPASLAAFQSFTRPGDPGTQAADLRDGLAGLLSAVPCSRLQVVFDPDTATLDLRGHLPDNALRQPILAALQAQMGRDIAVSDQMRLLPRPQCGALSGISKIGLPQSTDQITNPLLLGADAQARVLGYTGGEQLYFDLTAPDYPAYLYVDYFDAAGDVIHLSPNAHVPLALAAAKSAQRVGAKTPNDAGLQITVGPPYGQEIAVAFAASSPLYDGLRPLSEPGPAYLDFLRQKVTEIRSQDTDFKGEWVYFLIETQAE